jgi:hypothetical protein
MRNDDERSMCICFPWHTHTHTHFLLRWRCWRLHLRLIAARCWREKRTKKKAHTVSYSSSAAAPSRLFYFFFSFLRWIKEKIPASQLATYFSFSLSLHTFCVHHIITHVRTTSILSRDGLTLFVFF